MQTPVWQVSVCVQALPSLQALPSALLTYEQVPSPLQVPPVWQSLGGAHVYAVPVQLPLVQTSFFVHEFPSLHEVPSAFAGFEHWPVDALQVPTT